MLDGRRCVFWLDSLSMIDGHYEVFCGFPARAPLNILWTLKRSADGASWKPNAEFDLTRNRAISDTTCWKATKSITFEGMIFLLGFGQEILELTLLIITLTFVRMRLKGRIASR